MTIGWALVILVIGLLIALVLGWTLAAWVSAGVFMALSVIIVSFIARFRHKRGS